MITRALRGSVALSVIGAMWLAVGLLVASAVHSGESEDYFFPPDRAGGYSIGHTTVVVTDPARNLDGSSPVTSAGRFLFLDVWYPTLSATTQHVKYTWNNPLYNQNPGGSVYPGLPDLPSLTAEGSVSSNPVTNHAPLAKGSFPLLVASHGNLVASAKNMPDTLETLASHGYVVISIEHTGNDDAWYQANFIKSYIPALAIGPNPRLSAQRILLFSAPRMSGSSSMPPCKVPLMRKLGWHFPNGSMPRRSACWAIRLAEKRAWPQLRESAVRAYRPIGA